MTKSELRASLLNDQIAFALAGGIVEKLAPQQVKVKSLCRAKESRGRSISGNIPSLRISSTFIQI